MTSENQREYRETALGYSKSERLAIQVGYPACGLLLGLALPVLSRWILKLPVVPFGFVFRFVGAAHRPWEILLVAVVGLVAGAGVALVTLAEELTVTITDGQVRLGREAWERVVPRDEVDAVFFDGQRLVLLDRRSRQLVRVSYPARKAALASAFLTYGYPWRDADPYRDLYRRWDPETSELPAEVNAVLAARAVVLRKKSERDAQDLRTAAEQLGYVLRDEGDRQYWRPLVRS